MENSTPIITWFVNREDYGKQYSHNHMVCQCILEIMPPSGKEQNRQNHGIMTKIKCNGNPDKKIASNSSYLRLKNMKSGIYFSGFPKFACQGCQI